MTARRCRNRQSSLKVRHPLPPKKSRKNVTQPFTEAKYSEHRTPTEMAQLAHISSVNPRRARLVSGWVTVRGRIILLCTVLIWLPKPTQPGHPAVDRQPVKSAQCERVKLRFGTLLLTLGQTRCVLTTVLATYCRGK